MSVAYAKQTPSFTFILSSTLGLWYFGTSCPSTPAEVPRNTLSRSLGTEILSRNAQSFFRNPLVVVSYPVFPFLSFPRRVCISKQKESVIQ